VRKIVIKTDYPEENDWLIASLRLLFPECNIKVLSGPSNIAKELVV